MLDHEGTRENRIRWTAWIDLKGVRWPNICDITIVWWASGLANPHQILLSSLILNELLAIGISYRATNTNRTWPMTLRRSWFKSRTCACDRSCPKLFQKPNCWPKRSLAEESFVTSFARRKVNFDNFSGSCRSCNAPACAIDKRSPRFAKTSWEDYLERFWRCNWLSQEVFGSLGCWGVYFCWCSNYGRSKDYVSSIWGEEFNHATLSVVASKTWLYFTVLFFKAWVFLEIGVLTKHWFRI